jgi:hypothetical protein
VQAYEDERICSMRLLDLRRPCSVPGSHLLRGSTWPAWLRCRRRQVVAGVRWVSSILAGDRVGATVGTIREGGARHGQEKRSGLVGGGPR